MKGVKKMANERDVKIVREVADYVNKLSWSAEGFCECMAKEHRYLQNEFTLLCLEWLRTCASEDYGYDGRNEQSHNVGKLIVEKLGL